MTIKTDIVAAFELLEAKDDALWNADGTPKLEAIRNAAGDQRIKRDELIDAIGDRRRPVVKESAPQEQAPTEPATQEKAPDPEQPLATGATNTSAADPDADRPDTIVAEKPKVAGVADENTPDKQELIEMAASRIETIDAEAREVDADLQKLNARMATLKANREKQKAIVEENQEQLTLAEAVKRVQAQTQANLRANKDRISVAAAAVKAAGASLAPHASPLDAAYATRKRSPEEATRAAAYFAQRQTERVNERLGR